MMRTDYGTDNVFAVFAYDWLPDFSFLQHVAVHESAVYAYAWAILPVCLPICLSVCLSVCHTHPQNS